MTFQTVRQWVYDGIWVAVLALYILLGVEVAPFHPDEATLIAMSRDGEAFFAGDWERLRYRSDPPDPAAQELRLINGVIAPYTIALAWGAAGFTSADLNQPWDWGASYSYNRDSGHLPGEALRNAARLPSAILLALGLIPLFAIGRLTNGRVIAYSATLIYALHPALLINGRRAMMEGGLIAFSLLAVWMAVWLATTRGQRTGGTIAALLFGLAAGLAIAAKHTAVIAVVAAGVGVVIVALTQRAPRLLPLLALSAIVAGGVFYALNPAWWADPIARAAEVVRLRGDLLAGQTAAFGGYPDVLARLGGWLRHGLIGAPQYYEVAGWGDLIGDQISIYRFTGYPGWSIDESGEGFAAIVVQFSLLVAIVAGAITLVRQSLRRPACQVAIVWALLTLTVTLVATPIEWARYYLPGHPAVALLIATTIGAAILSIAERGARARESGA